MKSLSSGGVQPLLTPVDSTPGGEFDSIDPSVIDFPDKVAPLEDSFKKTSTTKPETAADIFNLSKQTNQPVEFLADNLESAKAASKVPSTQYFSEIATKYPQTAGFLSDPRHMAMAHDDIDNFTKLEKLVGDHSFLKTSYNSLNAGFADVNKTLAGVPNVANALLAFPWNFGAKVAGHPEKQVSLKFPGSDEAVKYWNDIARSYRPDINEASISDILATRNVSVISRAITSKIIEGAPSLALLMASAAIGGSGVGATVAGLGSSSDIYTRDKELGLDPSDATVNALYHGAVNAAFMNLGTYSPLQAWEHAITPRLGVDTARKVVLDVLKTMMGTASNFAGIMGATTLAGGVVDRSTGAIPAATGGLWKSVIDSSIEGFFTGALTGGITGTLGARARVSQLHYYDSTRSYSEIGKALAESKLSERSQEAHGEFLSGLVKDSDLESINVPAQAFETYFQSKNIDPNEMADRLGVGEQYAEAKNRGGDVQIPFQDWAGQLAKTPHFEGLKNDIRFDEGRPTINEAKLVEETVTKGMDEAVKNVSKENPAWEEGRQKVVDQFTSQLVASKAYNAKDAAIQAETGAKIIERLAATTGAADPASYLAEHPLEIVNGQMVPVKGDLMQEGLTQSNFDSVYTPTADTLEQSESSFVRENLSKFEKAYKTAAIEEVKTDFPNYVSADLAKTVDVPGRDKFTYDLSGPRHEGASAFAKMFYRELLNDPANQSKDVIVSAGISGAGKTSGLKLVGKDLNDYAAIFDTNLSSFNSSKRIVDAALNSNPERIVHVVYTDRDPLTAFKEGNYKRFKTHPEHRIVPIEPFISTLGARETISQLVEYYKDNPRVEFKFINNNGKNRGEMKETTLEKLPKLSYNKVDLKEQLNAFIQQKQSAGEITAEQAAAFTETQPRGIDRSTRQSAGSFGVQEPTLAYTQADQNDPTINPRASISFQADKALISLRSADPSSFMHEMGHYWLKNFNDFIATGKAGEKQVADWATLKKFLGIADDSKGITPEQQEKFARGFEKYLYEGKAPSEGLKNAFRKFRTWLSNIYRDPAALNVELTPEVRGVMDRMLASEEEIAFAERQSGLTDEYADLNIDSKVRRRLDSLRTEAHNAAVDDLFKQQMDEISKENKNRLVKEAAKARVEAEKHVRSSPIQEAIRAVGKNFKGDPIETAQDFFGNKMGDSSLLVNNPERAKFEQLAEVYGFSCGDELAQKMMNEPPVERQVQSLVDNHMIQFADLKDTAKIKEAAMAAVHSEKSTELMANEAYIFQNLVDEAQGRIVDQKVRAAQATIEAQAAKRNAERTILFLPVSEAKKFLPYFTAERNAAVRVKKALLDGDYAEAAKAKREQLLNHALVREAYAFKNEFQKTMRFFDRFASRGEDLKDIPYGFIRQIDQLLSARGLADPRLEDAQTYLAVAKDMATAGEDPHEIAHRTGWTTDDAGNWKQETLRDTVNRIQDDYRNVAVPESVMAGNPMDYRQMKVGDFRDLKTTIKALNAVGRGYDNFLDENIKLDRKTAALQLRKFIETNIGNKYAESRDIGKKPGSNKGTEIVGQIIDLPNAAIPHLVNLLRICDFLDAGNPDGLMKNLVYRPLLHSERGEITRQSEAITAINKVDAKYWKEGEYAKLLKQTVHIESRDRDMTMNEVLSVAFNQGTEINKQRVRDGYSLEPNQLNEILSKLGKREWNYIQAIWDHFDEYWPDIVSIQEKVAGETPEKVKATPVETPFGTLRGGYYPLSYDYSRSSEALNRVEARDVLYKTAGAVKAHTSHGFTESRLKNYVSPVRLDTNVIYTHLQDVIHDLSYRKAIIDVNGFLRQKDARESIINAIGLDGFRTIEQHVKWVAAEQGEPLHAADRILRRLRFSGTTAMLGLRPLNFPMDITGNLISTAQDVGPVKFANAIRDFVSNRDANVRFVEENSPRMAKRASLRDRDLMDMAKRLHGEESVFQHYLFFGASKADEAISFPLWSMTYGDNVDKFGHVKAVDIADEAVTKAVGSGSMLDQAMIQRGSEAKKIWTWWYSWSGMQFNRMWASGKFAGLEYDKGNVGTALSIVATAGLYGWAYQSLNENFWRELFRNSQGNNEEKKSKRIIQRTIMQPISYIPFVRDVAQYGLGKVMGTHADLQLPFQDSIKTMADPFADMIRAGLKDQSLSPRFWENTAKGLALGAGYPQYVNTLTFNFLDNLNGMGDASWRDLFTRKTKD